MNITASVEVSNAQYKQLQSDFIPSFQGSHTVNGEDFIHRIWSDGVVNIMHLETGKIIRFEWSFKRGASALRKRIRDEIQTYTENL